MIIYQVVDEENNFVSEYLHRDIAYHNAEEMTVWFSDHYYHVEELALQETGEVYYQRWLLSPSQTNCLLTA